MSRHQYIHNERVAIVQYIIEKKAYTSLRGNLFWKEMEASKILDRTWQSLKQHFKTTIIYNLRCYGIPQTEQENISKGYMMSSEKFAKPNKRKIVPLPEKEYPNIDFSDEETSQSLELVQGTVSSSDLSPDLSVPQKKSRFDRTPETTSSKENESDNIAICNLQRGTGKTFKKQELKHTRKSKTPIMFATSCSYRKQTENLIESANEMIEDLNTRNQSSLEIVQDSLMEVVNLDTPTVSPKNADESTLLNIDSSTVSQKNDDKSTFVDSANSATPKTFSREEEQHLVDFFRQDLGFFKYINNLQPYNLYKETTRNSRTSEELKTHFVQNIFPLLHEYGLEDNELLEINKIPGVRISKPLKQKVQELDAQDLIANVEFIYEEQGIIRLVFERQSVFVLKDCVDEEDYNNRLLFIKENFADNLNHFILWDTDKFNTLRRNYHRVKLLQEAETKLMIMEDIHLSSSSDSDDCQVVSPLPLRMSSREIDIKEGFDSQVSFLSETPNASQISTSISNNSIEIPIQPRLETLVTREFANQADVAMNVNVEAESQMSKAPDSSSQISNLSVETRNSQYLSSVTSQDVCIPEVLHRFEEVNVDALETSDDTCEESERTPSKH